MDIMPSYKSEMLCCSHCGDVVIKSMGDKLKIRTKILVVDEDSAYIVCRQCGTEIPIPATLDMNKMGNIVKSAKLMLFVDK